MNPHPTAIDAAREAAVDVPAPTKKAAKKKARARKAHVPEAPPVQTQDGAFQIPIGDSGEVRPSIWRFGE